MEYSNLTEILNKQEKNLKELLKIVTNKQEALVSNNNENLNDLISKEEKLLLQLQITEERRLEILKSIYEENNVKNERFKLDVMIEALKDKLKKEFVEDIMNSKNRIKNTIKQVTKINQQNLVLIQQSRELLNNTIQAVINATNRSILDRKG